MKEGMNDFTNTSLAMRDDVNPALSKSQSQRHFLRLSFLLCKMRMAMPIFLSESFGELEV